MIRTVAIAIISLAAAPAAGEISLAFPVDCELGKTCFIQHLVDTDPSPDIGDFQCGTLTYDGHKGTDFALPSLAAQAMGVTVFAAAAGEVKGVRNDMEDILQTGPDAPNVDNRECGNGVVIAHENGYETQYCHMAKGSVTVTTGQQVEAGTPLGLIGLSGKTQFPHLHLSVRHRGAVIDPFDTIDARRCNDPLDPIWEQVPDTPAGGLISVGLHDGVPEYDEIKAGTADLELRATDAALVAWAYAYMTRKGDVLHSVITGPSGVEVDQSEVLKRDQAQMFRAMGRRTPAAGWPKGDYLLEITLTRDGQTLDRATHAFRLD